MKEYGGGGESKIIKYVLLDVIEFQIKKNIYFLALIKF